MLKLTEKKLACIPLFDSLKSAGGLHIPEQARERCDQGIVKYIGAKCDFVEPGDHVLFSGYTGTLLELEGEGLLIILPEEFVTAIIEYDGHEVANIDISGLYFKDKEGRHWPASYEIASRLIAKSLEESPFFQRVTAYAWKNTKLESRPKISDYNNPALK